MTQRRYLVPVSDSPTLRKTVAEVIETAIDASSTDATDVVVHFVYPLSQRLTFDRETDETEQGRRLLDRVRVWAEEDMGEAGDSITIETALIGAHTYLFSPGDYADVLVQYASDHDISSMVFDPGFNPLGTTPLLPPLESEVRRAGLEVREADVQRERQNPLLVRRGTLSQFFGLFGIAYGFYLLLAGSVAPFELATGAISAGVVAVALWGISLTTPAQPRRTAQHLARFALYVPYLLWEIAIANVQIAYVVLHPALPIDPSVERFDAAVWGALPVTTLANSITLTPGTLTVDVTKDHFTVHTLTAGSRADLFDGSLERAVRFVFYGRAAARIPTPAERAAEGDGEE